MKKIVAITGGIGSGKSLVLSILSRYGFGTINCDELVSKLYKKRSVKKRLRTLFPTAVSGLIRLKLDRQELARQVFNDSAKLKSLNDLVFPLVFNLLDRILKHATDVIFVEVPLLFESNAQSRFDVVMVIKRNLSDRIKSACTRSNLSEEQVVARINAQFDYDNADLSPYVVIENDGDVQKLSDTVIKFATSLIPRS